MTIKIRASESVEKYSDCIFQIIDMLFEDINKKPATHSNRNEETKGPEITEKNQFQMLHLFALFGLNDKKERLTQFIQANINPRNLFNYLLCISEYIMAGLQDTYVEEIKY